MKRVVVTGLGMVSPLGNNVKDSWTRLLAKQSGIELINDVYFGSIKGFTPQKIDYCDSNLNQYALAAVQEALNHSGLKVEGRDDVGVNIGVMNSSLTKVTEIIQTATVKGFNKITPFTMLHVLSNIPTALITIKYNVKGPSSTAVSACATGASAIGDSYRKIKYGEVNAMIAGGTEDCFNQPTIFASSRMQAMNTKKYETPGQASRPFDESRSGFILSEGSGVVILEELEHAKSRGAQIFAELVGYGESSDAFHLTRPQDFGEGGQKSMMKAKNQAQLNDVDLINCHATSTPAGDLSEIRAIGESKAVLVANKSQLGHTFGAAGAIETIFTILSLHHQIVPATINLDKPITNKCLSDPQDMKIDSALKNAFGFGGVNVSLCFKRY